MTTPTASTRPARVDWEVTVGDPATLSVSFVDPDGDPVDVTGTWAAALPAFDDLDAVTLAVDATAAAADDGGRLVVTLTATLSATLSARPRPWYLRDTAGKWTPVDGTLVPAAPGRAGHHRGEDSAVEVTVAAGDVVDVRVTTPPAGPPGPPGATGAPGPGLPTGGTTGQVPRKASGTDYDTAWDTLTAEDLGAASASALAAETGERSLEDGLIQQQVDTLVADQVADVWDILANWAPGPTLTARAIGAANRGYYYRLTSMRRPRTITHVRIHMSSVTSPGTTKLSVAVFANNGRNGKEARPAARKATSGAVDAVVGAQDYSLGGSVTVEPGDWLFVSCTDNTSQSYSVGTSVASDLMEGRQGYAASQHPAPSTAAGSLTWDSMCWCLDLIDASVPAAPLVVLSGATPASAASPVTISDDGHYDAFGSVAKISTTEWLIAYRRGTSHVGGPGVIVARRTTDSGSTWSPETTVFDPGSSHDARDASLSVLGDGRVALATWIREPDGGPQVTNGVRVLFSSDNGATWSSPATPADGMALYSQCAAPVIDAHTAGTLLLPVYGRDTGSKRTCRLLKSTNGGTTWTVVADVSASNVESHEMNVVRLAAANTLAAVIRNADSQRFDIAYSADDGATWTVPEELFGPASSAPRMLRMGDGRIFLPYRGPASSNYQALMRTGSSDAKTWSATPAVLDATLRRFLYGDTLEVASGSLVCVFSIEGSPATSASIRRAAITVT